MKVLPVIVPQLPMLNVHIRSMYNQYVYESLQQLISLDTSVIFSKRCGSTDHAMECFREDFYHNRYFFASVDILVIPLSLCMRLYRFFKVGLNFTSICHNGYVFVSVEQYAIQTRFYWIKNTEKEMHD